MANGIPSLQDLPLLPSLTEKFPVQTIEDGAVEEPTFEDKAIKKAIRGKPDLKKTIIQEIQRTQDQSLADSAKEVLSNAGVEAKDIILGIPLLGYNLAKKAITSALHPIDTAEYISSGDAYADLKDVIEVIKNDYDERYTPLFEGDFQGFADQFKEKPLSFLMDLGTGLSLAGGSAKLAGKALGDKAASEALRTTGTNLVKVGEYLDPLSLVTKGVGATSEAFPKLPLIGKEARIARSQRKLGITLANDWRKEFYKELEGTYDEAANINLSQDELTKLWEHKTGIKPVDILDQSDDFKKASALYDKINVERSKIAKDLYGLSDESMRKRAMQPLIMEAFDSGKFNPSPQLMAKLEEGGFLKATRPLSEAEAIEVGLTGATPKREFNFGNVDDLPDQLFDEAFEQLPAASQAQYVPLLLKEAVVTPKEFIPKLGTVFESGKSRFQKDFTGETMNRVLRSKDPNILADIKETMKMMVVSTANEKAMAKLRDKVLSAVDPATGEKLAKRLFLGKTPTTNLLEFSDGADAAKIINAMENPLTGLSEDEIYKKVFGKNASKKTILDNLQANNKKAAYASLEELANETIKTTLAKDGYDGYIATNGRFKLFDEAKSPFPGRLPGHVIYAPEGTLKFLNRQKAVAETVMNGLDNSSGTAEEILNSAAGKIFGNSEADLEALQSVLNHAQNKSGILLNDALVDPKNLSKFVSEFKSGLKDKLKGIKINDSEISGLIKEWGAGLQKGASDLKAAEVNWVYQIPKTYADGIMDSFKPLFQSSNLNTAVRLFYDSPMQAWRMLALNLSGRWHVNNALGNIVLNTLAGVINPMDYMRAGKVLGWRLAQRFPRAIGIPREILKKAIGATDADLTAASLSAAVPTDLGDTFSRVENYPLHLGIAAESPIGKMQSWIAESKLGKTFSKAARSSGDLNSLVDQFFKDANYFSQVRGQIRKESKGVIKKLTASFDVADDELVKFAENMNDVTRKGLVEKTNQFLVDFTNLLDPVERKVMRRIIPFYSWYKHMVGVAFMMPLNYPGRTNFVANLAKTAKGIEDQEWVDNGVDPKDIRIAANYLEGSKILSTQSGQKKFLLLKGVNPLASLLELDNVGNLLNPALKAAVERITKKDLFTGRDFTKTVKIGPDGEPVEEYNTNLFDTAIKNVPQAELIKRLISPEVTDIAGETIYRRDRALEIFKMLGLNIQERDVDQIKSRAAKTRGELVGKAFNQFYKENKKDPNKVNEILRIINSQ